MNARLSALAVALSLSMFAQPSTGRCHLQGEILGVPPGTRDLVIEVANRDRSEPPLRGYAGASGTFEFSGLEPGIYAIEVRTWHGDLLRSEQVTVHAASAPVRITLPARAFGRPASGTVSVERLKRDPSGESVRQFREAARLFSQGDRKRGMKHLLKSLDRDPDFAEARVALGAVLAEKSDWKGAVEEFRRAVASDPKLARAGELLATALLQLEQFDEAESASRQVLVRYPNNLLAQHLLGLALVQRGIAGEEALGCFRRASAEVPQAAEAYRRLGEYLSQNRNAVK